MGFEMAADFESVVQIKVIGVGGGGGNAVNRMIRSDVRGVEFISVNTDKHVLLHSQATHKLQIGEKVTKGKVQVQDRNRQRAAEESRDTLSDTQRYRYGVYNSWYGWRNRYRCRPVVHPCQRNGI